LLQAAHSNHQIGAFENFHQLVEDMLIVLRPGPKVFFQYELRFVNRLKRQLLISHSLFSPSKKCRPNGEKEATKQAAFWEISPLFLEFPINFYFNAEASAADSATLPGSTRFRSSFEWPPRVNWRVCQDSLLAALVGSGTVLPD
jgi:hypothetical protein